MISAKPKLDFISEEINNSKNIQNIGYCKKIIKPTNEELENYKVFMKKSLKKTI